jgi:hypothetical protein
MRFAEPRVFPEFTAREVIGFRAHGAQHKRVENPQLFEVRAER